MEVNNRIRTASIDPCLDALPKSNEPEVLTQGSKTCLESPYKILAQSNSRIENYDYCRKPGLLRFLRQNSNLTLLGLEHRAEPYHFILSPNNQ